MALVDHSLTVTTTAADALDAVTSKRSYLMIYNHGSVIVYCRWGATAVAAAAGTFGIPANGGNMLLTNPDPIPGERLSVITGSGTAVLTVQTMP